MRCPKCGADNREVRKFCAKCAVRLPRPCSRCGASNEPGEDFCGECGTALGVSAAAASAKKSSGTEIRIADTFAPENLEGERKTLTILFADIKSSMELIEDLDPEDARTIVDPALKLMMEAVQRYGGYVAQPTGDGIFALFGAPLAHEDHPQRALHAALQMQEELKRYSNRIRAEGRLIQARVGAHTGEVVVRSITTGEGRTDYAPVGHSTGIAARMQALAPIGSIAATEQIRKLCEGYFAFKSLGPTKVKGVSEPINVYEVTGLGPLRTRLQRSAARGYTKFVGREREMNALQHAAERARAGRGQIVAVVAEPGVGKSRLFDEFKTRNQSGWMVLEGPALAYGKASAFLPLIELLRNYFGITSDDGEHTRREKVAGKIAILDRLPEDALSYLCGLLGLGDSQVADVEAPIRKRRALDAIGRIFLRESLNQPLIVIFEDLHRIDEESQAFLNLLAESIGTAKVLLLVNYRPEYRHEWGHKTYYTQLRLDPLAKASAEEMLQSSLGNSADLAPLRRLIIEKTEGNPLFMEETVHMLFEEGALVRNGAVRLTRCADQLAIPTTVQAILTARIDRLPDEQKDLLQTLAVLGTEFRLAVVRKLIGLPDQELERMLAALQSSEFIYEQPASGDVEYIFKHALTHDVAYKSVLNERRRLLHARTGGALESIYAESLDDHVAELAYHYRMAGAAADADKTVDYSIRAGRAAYAVFAYEEAGTHWRAALELMGEQGGGDRRRRAGLLWLLGDELISRGAKAVEYLEAAAPLFAELDDSEAECDVHLRIATYLGTNHLGSMDMRRAMPHYKKAEALLAKQPESHLHAAFYARMASSHIWTNRIEDGLATAKRAMEICERQDLDALWSWAAILSSVFHVHSGLVTEGLRLADQARRRADPIEDTMTGSLVALGGGNYLQLRNPLEGQEWYESELAKPRTANAVRRLQPYTPPRSNVPLLLHRFLLTACIDAGELSKARAHLAEVGAENKPAELLFFESEWKPAAQRLTAEFERSRTTGNRLLELLFALDLARLHRFTGERALAAQFLRRALEISVDGGDILAELTTRSGLATMAADVGDADEALQHLQRCRQIVGAGENWLGLAGSVERAEAVVAAAQGEYSAAEAYFEKAIATFKRYCLPWEEADTLQYWGRALLTAGQRARAIEKFGAAIEIYRSRGAGARFIEYVMVDKMRAQGSKSICAEGQPPLTDSTPVVPERVAQERPDRAHPRSNGSGYRKLGPG